jgi:hypothetical protein
MSGANASPKGRSNQRMTAQNAGLPRVMNSAMRAVIDRAYNSEHGPEFISQAFF